ncbi:MAG: hypothetical protein JOZ36_02455 [Acidobacteria bacterium]|nr:hypothetical protein [Acidobacteriota bacterium]
MMLLSALDDFLTRTLAAIPGLLARLEYVSSLNSEGRYGHWGLSRVHGERKAQRALSEAHRMVIGEILQTPLQALVKDSEAACAAEGRVAPNYLEDLRERRSALLPSATSSPATTRHFSSVLHALSALSRAQRRATHPGA